MMTTPTTVHRHFRLIEVSRQTELKLKQFNREHCPYLTVKATSCILQNKPSFFVRKSICSDQVS